MDAGVIDDDSWRAWLAAPWGTTRISGDPLVFVGDATERVSARLLFEPAETVTITDSTGAFTYVAGVDYAVGAASRDVVRLPGSRLPHLAAHDLAALDPRELLARTVQATYEHGEAWPGDVPADKSARLPLTSRVLRQGAECVIGVMGDSISEGYDASGFLGVAPHQPPYLELVRRGLELASSARVTVRNHAVAGWTTEDAAWLIPEVVASAPTLVVIAFGMNDACYATASAVAGRVSSFVRALRDRRPEVECLLVAPMAPTPRCTWVAHDFFNRYRDALAALESDGVAAADVTRVWRALLTRKDA